MENNGKTENLSAELMHTQKSNQKIIDIAIKLSALALLVYWCFSIVSPFLMIALWSAILAVALKPLHNILINALKGRNTLAAVIIAIVGISLIAVPAVSLSVSSIKSAQHIYTGIEEGTLKMPKPAERVKAWPLIGEKTYKIWQSSSEDFPKFLSQFPDKIESFSASLLSIVASLSGGILQFIISLIVATVLMARSEACNQSAGKFASRIMGANGIRTINTAVSTIRSVATGVLGVAVIQSLLAGIGLLVADIPAAGLWALAVFILAVAQLPPIVILGPIAAYYFSIAGTTPAVIFLIFCLVVSGSDAFLKPLFLGRGMDIPMLVILLGAIGGMLLSGVVGLFVGAVILALGYQLLLDWLAQQENAHDKGVDHS